MNNEIEIRFLRLYSGENLVTQVIKNKDANTEFMTISYPMRVDIELDMEGRPMMSMVEWVPIALIKEREMPIKNSDIMMELTPSERMNKAYVNFTDRIKRAENQYVISEEPADSKDYESMDEMQDGLGTLEDLLETIKNKRRGTLH